MSFTLPQRLAAFYFAYYATVGAFMAYWSPYLVARGLSPTQLGITYALMGLSRATVPLLWGWMADRRGERMGVIRMAALASLAVFVTIPFAEQLGMIMALTLGYTLFWNALLPQFEVVALHHLREGGGDYPRVRLWGSVGFIVALLSVGSLIDATSILWEPWFVAVLFAAMAGAAWAVPDIRLHGSTQVVQDSLWQVLRDRRVQALLAVCFCSQFSFAPYYQFYTLLMDLQGYSRSFSGLMWSLAVVAEIVLFLFAARLLKRFEARSLMLVVMATTVLRWLLIGFGADSLAVLVFAQLLHAVSFGGYHALAMHYVQTLFPPSLQGRGQALYSSASYGLGGALGSLATGWLWEHSPPWVVYLMAAAVAALGLWVAARYLAVPARTARIG
jgi:PPP family 3-phenylpropionic acid transporter